MRKSYQISPFDVIESSYCCLLFTLDYFRYDLRRHNFNYFFFFVLQFMCASQQGPSEALPNMFSFLFLVFLAAKYWNDIDWDNTFGIWVGWCCRDELLSILIGVFHYFRWRRRKNRRSSIQRIFSLRVQKGFACLKCQSAIVVSIWRPHNFLSGGD